MEGVLPNPLPSGVFGINIGENSSPVWLGSFVLMPLEPETNSDEISSVTLVLMPAPGCGFVLLGF